MSVIVLSTKKSYLSWRDTRCNIARNIDGVAAKLCKQVNLIG